jgi:hypothetical protein
MQPISPAASIAYFNSPEPDRPKYATFCSRRPALALVLAGMVIIARPAMGQVMPLAAATNAAPALAVSETATTTTTNPPQDARALAEKTEEIRTACIYGRRRICGKVLQIVPEGLVVESGYTNLLRPELSHSWLAPGNVTSSLPPNLVEQNSPGAVCVGLVLVTDIPKRPAVKAYDYVIFQVYPAGQYDYMPVPAGKKIIRRFSVGLATAVQLNLAAGEK